MDVSRAFQVLAAPRRRELLRRVWNAPATAGELAAAMPDVTFGAVSQHLAVLREAGMVSVETAGRQRVYRAVPEALGPLATQLEAMWSHALYQLKLQAELLDARRGPRRARRRATPAARKRRA